MENVLGGVVVFIVLLVIFTCALVAVMVFYYIWLGMLVCLSFLLLGFFFTFTLSSKFVCDQWLSKRCMLF